MNRRSIDLESVINTREQPAVVIDAEYRIVAANRAYCESYGVDPGTVVGRKCHEVSHRSERPCDLNGEPCPLRAALAGDAPLEVLHTHYDPEGRPDHVRVKSFPLVDASGQRLAMETIHRLAPPAELGCEEMRMIGRSPAFVATIESLSTAAKSTIPVLIHGETGVGKELAASFVHEQSGRAHGPYVELNCAAIPEDLCESELFGHEKGAFTGSTGTKRGLFELADGGSLFLDEVGELSLPLQAKLLRVLDSGRFRRVGGKDLISVDVRIIAATNRSLRDMVREGSFREDLYFRLAGISVNIPPLRERKEDIPALAKALVERMSREEELGPYHVTRDAIEKLMDYSFPGNVRELRNILHKAVALCRNGVITAEEIQLDVERQAEAHGACDHARVPIYNDVIETPPNLSMEELEIRHIGALLRAHGGNRRKVASILGISERTLYRKIKRYGLNGTAAHQTNA